ncbi:MAG: hypothetical protein NTX44_00045 [Ignavibacteriales bacterium]|nr:hypothetical protein [Ignavibacteriales bacterium]
MTSHVVIKQDLGFNFRFTDDFKVVFTDSTILNYNVPSTLLYYRISSQSDTLIFSYDSLFRFPYLAIIDSAPDSSNPWAPTIRCLNKTWFNSNASSHINGVDHYGDHWYFREEGYQSSTINVCNVSGLIVKSYILPGVTSVDIAGGYLWTAGSYYVDQRNIEDTTLIRRINLTSQYSFQHGKQINSLAIYDSLIVIAFEEYLLLFDFSGRFIRQMSTYDGIFSMSFVGDKLIVGTNYSTINTVDIATGCALDSYLLPDALFEGPYGYYIYPVKGIVEIGGHVGAFRQTSDAIYLYEFTLSQ